MFECLFDRMPFYQSLSEVGEIVGQMQIVCALIERIVTHLIQVHVSLHVQSCRAALFDANAVV